MLASILQQLKNAGQANITDSLIQDWCLPLSPDPKDAAEDLVLRLTLLWTLLENWKVLLAVIYNPLMTALGYTDQGQDFGWQKGAQTTSWSTMPSTPHQLSKVTEDAKMMHILYRALLGQTAALSVTTTEFKQAMSLAFGPHPNWALPCNIAQPSHEIPPLLNHYAPPGEKCSHCNLFFHEEHRC